jgi:hypothetical protein
MENSIDQPLIEKFGPPAVKVTVRWSGYTIDELEDIKLDLSQVAHPQMRRLGMPDAGGSFDMRVVIEWASLAVLGGVVGNAAYDALKQIGGAILLAYKRKRALPGKFAPELQSIAVSFSDVDVEIVPTNSDRDPTVHFMNVQTIKRLSTLLEYIITHLNSEPLVSRKIVFVKVFEPSFSETTQRDVLFDRPWKVSVDAGEHNAILYDPAKRQLL